MAVAHSVLVIAYHVLDQGVAYQELGDDYSSSATPPNTTSGSSSANSSGSVIRSPWNPSRRHDHPTPGDACPQRHFRFSRGVPCGDAVRG